MEPERIAETLKAVVAYQLLVVAAEGDELLFLPAGGARLLHRIIAEPDYRAIVMDGWSEIFEHGNGEMWMALKEMIGDSPLWEDLMKQNRDASPTGDTPLINKS